jgi:hypothetical protein
MNPKQPAATTNADHSPVRAVIINGVRLSDEQVQALEQQYHVPIQDGAYWYDRLTGAWGAQGGPTVGFIHAGLNLGGQLRADASKGNTGVWINGRQLHIQDVLGLQRIVPYVLPGHYWMDAQGSFGYEGGPILGNIWLLAQANRGAGGAWTANSSYGTVGGDGNGFLFYQGNDGTVLLQNQWVKLHGHLNTSQLSVFLRHGHENG